MPPLSLQCSSKRVQMIKSYLWTSHSLRFSALTLQIGILQSANTIEHYMDISLETAIDHLRQWKTSSCPLSVAVRSKGVHVVSRATVKSVSANMVVFGLSEVGDSLSVLLRSAPRFRSFLPSEPPPPDIGGSHRACVLFLVITLQDGSLCKVCELSEHANFPVQLFSDTSQ